MGGAFSDLVSRVYNLERVGLKTPDLSKIVKFWRFGLTGADGLILPDFDPKSSSICYSPKHTIPQDGFLIINSLMNSSQSNQEDSAARAEVVTTLNGNSVMITTASGVGGIKSCDGNVFSSFVRKGDYFQFSNLTVGRDWRPDVSGCWVTVSLFGYVS